MKRKFTSLLATIAMIFSIIPGHIALAGYSPRTSSPNGVSYYYSSNNPFYSSGYVGECTWYAWGRAYEILGSKPSLPTSGAGKWYGSCTAYPKSSNYNSAKVGAIACYNNHVAVVEEVGSNGAPSAISEGGFCSPSVYGQIVQSINGRGNRYFHYGKDYSSGFQGYIYILSNGESSQPEHTHSWSYDYESGHPHKQYRTCSCGAKEYTGGTRQISSCASCYPIGNVSLTRSFERTKKNVTFHRNNVSNANSYTLTLYRGGSYYDSYTMNSTSQYVSGLKSGTYTATLTAKNTNTSQTRQSSCKSFTIVDSYTVSYNANGGTGAPSAQTKIQGETLTLTSTKPTRAHYIFKGWAASKKAAEPQYASGSEYTKNTPITLYAVWEPEVYTISFDTNNGKGDVPSTTITYGNTMKMPNSVIKDGFYLKGWAKSKSATSADYRIGMDYALEENATLYAVWGSSTWSGDVASKFAGGDGTADNPYQISNASELAYLADKVNQQTASPAYEYYILTDNISLGGEEWVPIGNLDYSYQYFCGSLDGNGFTVSDLSISEQNTGNIGLIGAAKESDIKNLTVVGDISSVNSTDAVNIGAIAANAENTDITGCKAMYVNMSNISSSSTNISSSGYCNVGCVVGTITGGSISDTTADECYINPKGGSFNLGMIAGSAAADITNCDVTAEEGLFGTGSAVIGLTVGALCGVLTKSAKNCTVNAGYLSNTLNSSYPQRIGGLVGYLSGSADVCAVKFTADNTKTIDGTSYKSSIFATSSEGSVSAGGIAGSLENTAKITDCMYDGKSISGTSPSGYGYTGGLAAYATAKSTTSVSAQGGQSLNRSLLPTRDGYKATWYTDSALTKEYDFSQDVTADFTLYAKWTDGTEKEIWDGTSTEPAYDADTKTYTVTNGQELAWISDVSNGVITTGINFPTDKTFSGYTVKLTDNISLNDTSDVANWETTAPKNTWTSIESFAGTFDGCGNMIYGLYSGYGLFGNSLTGIVKNVNVSDGLISTSRTGGAICRSLESGTIEHCINYSVNVEGPAGDARYLGVGGIAGVSSTGKISYCRNMATIHAGISGGICGSNFATISYCYNKGKISHGYLGDGGGISGRNEGNISYCYNTGYIKEFCGNSGGGAGGIVGINDNDESNGSESNGSSIKYCYNVGDISGFFAGGIVGESYGSSVMYCYNIGVISGTNTSANTRCGIIGLVNSTGTTPKTTISYCYATQKSLYYTSSSATTTATSVSYKSAAAMKTLSNLTGFSTSVWAANSSYNGGYPYLQAMEETYKTYKVTLVTDTENSAVLSRSFANVDGILYSNAGASAYSGGILGRGNGASGASSGADKLLTISDRVSSVSSGSSYSAYSGDIVGYNVNNVFQFSDVYSYSDTEISATNTAASANAKTNTISETRPKNQITRLSFLNNVFGPDTYQSLDYLEEHPDAVWVVREGELPELYHTLLRDITLSDVENGTISVDKPQAVDGEIVTVTATANDGYVPNTIYVNGTEIEGTTFEVSGDSNVYATFSEKTPVYNVKAASDENASVSLSNADNVNAESLVAATTDSLSAEDGAEIVVSADAAEEYTVDALYVNGEEMASDSFIVTADSNITMDVTSLSTDVKATTGDAQSVGNFFALLSGTVEGDENTEKYIRYWEKNNPDTVYTTEVQTGSGDYEVFVEELLPSTTYQYQMCESGDIKTFTTLASVTDDGTGDETVSADFTIEINGTTAEVTNTGDAQSATVIIVCYDNDIPKTVSSETIAFAEGETRTFSLGDDGEYKVFVWDSLNGMRPLNAIP